MMVAPAGSQRNLQVAVSHVLSQDVVTTSNIPVDVSSSTPVGVFVNPVTKLPEALVVARPGDAPDAPAQPAHVARDTSTEAAWKLSTPFAGHSADEVATGTAYPGTSDAQAFAFFTENGTLYSSSLGADGTTWSPPQAIEGAEVNDLHVANSPAGRLVLYGRGSRGELVTAHQDQVGGTFVMTVCQLGLATGDFQLVMTDETSWTLAANVDGKPQLASGDVAASAPSSVSEIPSYERTLKHVALGHFNNAQQATVFLLVDEDDGMHMWSATADTAVVEPVRDLKVTSATGHVAADEDGTLHVYAIDKKLGLWAYHQHPRRPWKDDGSPNWAPPIPLDTGIAAVASSGDPADAPTLFAIDQEEGALRVHVQDAQSMMWRAGEVRQAKAGAYEVSRYRTEIAVMDENGVPMADHPVKLAVASGNSACEAACQGAALLIDQDGADLRTDVLGKATIAMLPMAGLSAPDLLLTADGLGEPVHVRPAGGVMNYLSGNGTLNPTNPRGPLPQFDADGKTLAAAKVPGPTPTPLAPKASTHDGVAAAVATGIQHTAQVGLGTHRADVAGYHLHLGGARPPAFHLLHGLAEHSGTPTPDFRLLHSPEELDRARGVAVAAATDVWSDIGHFFGDIWTGIANGVIAISRVVVDVANKIADFVVDLGDRIDRAVKLVVKGLEQAAHFVAACFQAVAAAIKRVIDWLKALFDFGAIWRTKQEFERLVVQMPASLKEVLQGWEQEADRFFDAEKSRLHDYFQRAIDDVSGKPMSSLKGFQPPGKPDASRPVAGGAAPADFNNNAHHNWLSDKVAAAPPSSVPAPGGVEGPFEKVAGHLESAGQDFAGAMDSAADAIKTLIEHPSQFATTGVADLIKTAEGLADTGLDLAESAADGLLELGIAALEGASHVLEAELDLGPVNYLWSWLAKAAGYPDDDKLTMAALAALLAAFPATVAFKLIRGVDQEPFPRRAAVAAGHAVPAAAAALPALSDTPEDVKELLAGIVQALYVVPAVVSDLVEPDLVPTWLSVLGASMSALIFALEHSLPFDLWVGGASAVGIGALIALAFAFPVKFLWAWFRRGEIAAVLFTLAGLASIGATVYGLTKHQLSDAQLAAGFLVGGAGVFSFLTYPAIRKSAIGGPAMIFKGAVDAVGYFGGGLALIVDSFERRPRTA